MNKFYTFALALFAVSAFAQAPAGYYNSATGTGYTLKNQLFNIIKNHNDRGYAGLYVTYLTSDKDLYYENNGSVLDMYSEKPNGPDSYEYQYGSAQQDDGTLGTAEGQRFNREHIVPQSYFGSALPMYADAHFIVPADKFVNGRRDNLPFGVVATANLTTTNGSKKGNNLNSGYSAGYTAEVFEPIDEFKGDIARMILYFATSYQDKLPGFYTSANASSTQSKAMFDGTADKAFSTTFLNILLAWNTLDPVSQREIDRNNAIYARQNNRNPFIDRPEFVTAIWGASLGTNEVTALNNVSVYPNPSNNHQISLYSPAELESVQIININGQLIQQINKPVLNNGVLSIDNLPQGFYLLKIDAKGSSVTKKVMIN